MFDCPHQLANVVQRNCNISDARYAGDYSLCIFLLKIREFYRWENALPFSRALPKNELGNWLNARENLRSRVGSEDFAQLPLMRARLDPYDAKSANRELLPQGYVYSAGYGRFQKPLFF